uniref:SCP domain-containing protein n=1 Tax=Salmo trutta TaxID=8032 RepID=A0A674EQ16_SALTR
PIIPCVFIPVFSVCLLPVRLVLSGLTSVFLLFSSFCFLVFRVLTFLPQKTIVDKHNNLRRGVQPTASNMLKMVHWCAMSNIKEVSRYCSPDVVGCGENLYMASYKSSWSNVIQSWADEVKDFQYGPVNEPVFSFCAQVVWYRSNQISCAMAHCPNSNYKYFYVCHNCSP